MNIFYTLLFYFNVGLLLSAVVVFWSTGTAGIWFVALLWCLSSYLQEYLRTGEYPWRFKK